ncbi:MAG: universal stress protein [Candidatus Nitrosotenuis sp.]
MKIKRILVPLDGSENSFRSLKYALDIASQCGASVIALHVFTDMSLFTAVHAIIIHEDKWESTVSDFMKKAKKIAEKTNVPFEEIVIGGNNAGYDIVTFADSKSAEIDLIVIGRRGLSFPKEIILGSTTNFVLHKSKIPVLVTR